MKPCICLGSCKLGRRVGRIIKKSLLQDHWEVGRHPLHPEYMVLTRGNISVIYQVRRLRIFDQIMVKDDGADVYIPLITRLCLRSAVRFRTATAAYVTVQSLVGEE